MSSKKVIIYFAVIWTLAIFTAVAGFYVTWNKLPSLISCIMSATLLAAFALPKTFANSDCTALVYI